MNPKTAIANLEAMNRRQRATMEDLSKRYVHLEAKTKKRVMDRLREVVEETRGWPAVDAIWHIEQFAKKDS